MLGLSHGRFVPCGLVRGGFARTSLDTSNNDLRDQHKCLRLQKRSKRTFRHFQPLSGRRQRRRPMRESLRWKETLKGKKTAEVDSEKCAPENRRKCARFHRRYQRIHFRFKLRGKKVPIGGEPRISLGVLKAAPPPGSLRPHCYTVRRSSAARTFRVCRRSP